MECFGDGVVGGFVVVFVAAFGKEGFEVLFFDLFVEQVELVADGAGTVADASNVVIQQFVEGSEERFAVHGGVVYHGFGQGFAVVVGRGVGVGRGLHGVFGFGSLGVVDCVRVVVNGL